MPPGSAASLHCNAASAPEALAPRGAAASLQMISIDLLAPFATPPYLAVKWVADGPGGGPGGAQVNLPLLSSRWGSPWPLGKDDFFRLWRTGELPEAQTKFTFNGAHEPSAIKALLASALRLAPLEGVDPSPNNVCAAGAIACKSGVMPPAPGGHYALLRLEIIPNYAKAPDGSPRAASRLTCRATHAGIAESIVAALTAHLGG